MADPISRVIRALESGDYSSAKGILNRYLKTNRTDTRALYFLGVAEQAMSAPDAALSLFDRVLALDPMHAKAHYSKALLLMNLGRHAEAMKHHTPAVRLDPRNFWARLNRGNSFAALKQLDDALEDYEAVIAVSPEVPEAWDNKGNVLRELKQPEAALASYDHALKLRPEYAGAWSNRGNALLDLGRPEEALASNDRALKLMPEYAEAWSNRGNALLDLRRPEEALESYHHALKLKPEHAEAWSNRGNALAFLKRREEALESYDRALELKPDYPEALNNRGQVLLYLNRQDEAAQAYARLLELEPNYRYAQGDLLHAKMLCYDWGGLAALAGSIETDLRAGRKSTEPFEFQAISSSAQDLRRCAEIYAAERYPRAQTPVWAGERYRNTRIRIGYVSGEFRQQATSILIAGLFEQHDKDRCELFAFDNGWDDASEIRGRINRAFGEIVNITRMPDPEAAAAIKRKQIDILVNLNGYFGEARQGLFALRPCPIQVNYLGFPGTLGADYMDYILADRHVIPAEHEACYTEKVVYLPDTYQVNDSRRVIAERTPSRAEAGLPETGFVFCCFNNSYKITPAIIDRWMRLLNEVPGSVLWLLESNAAASRNLRREAEARGVAPERVVFASFMKPEDHLARHRLADLFLDTLPYNAHTTASDALWAGLPVLTCLGTTFPGRVAASLLNSVGLPELITHSLDEYESLALQLARNPERLAGLKAKLARNRGTYPLFDTDRFRRHIESAYTTMWERYQRGEPPRSFAVEAIDGD